MNREPWVIWGAAGALPMEDRIKSRLWEILDTHQPPPLPDGVAGQIEAILQAAEARRW
jgi:trimethylamine:corrinoid methyltransferase-like protein